MNPTKRLALEDYVSIIDNIDDAVIAINQTGTIILFNPAAQNFTGLSERQALGKVFCDCFQQQESLCELARTTLREGRSLSDHEAVTFESLGRRRKRQLSVSVSPILASTGQQQGAIVIMHDLTQVRSLEEAVRHADRLTMVGTMAAGLAHEIKNPLGGIKGAAQLLQMELSEHYDLQEYTSLIIRESERINRIIVELLDLAAPRRNRLEPVNINQLLNEIITLHRHSEAARHVNFKLLLDPSIPSIYGDSDLLSRLLLNLLKNAWEASSEHTEIIIETRIDGEYYLSVEGSRPTPLIQVSISDRGPGLSRTEIEQIFTPFYTTKDGGSGLGLPICQKIVADHGGLLHFNEHPDGGTIVTVSLPLLRTDRNEQAQTR